ncbi:MAG TPA: hypothetical protein VD993_20210 [Chitinophagaceae bacterium]|nr:hypothetical protein [Chitinophagaceae bacterium]
MKPLAAALVLVLAIAACNDNNTPTEKDYANAPKFFPVANYIRDDIKSAGSEPIGVQYYFSSPQKKDSSYIGLDTMKQLAQQAFLVPEIEKENFERSFKETTFLDETTQMATLTYQSMDSTTIVKRVDVLLEPGTQADDVRTIYMEKMYNDGDTAVIQRMSWKRTWFKIITLKMLRDNPTTVETLMIGWDPSVDVKKMRD